jgi:hypothetical protein
MKLYGIEFGLPGGHFLVDILYETHVDWALTCKTGLPWVRDAVGWKVIRGAIYYNLGHSNCVLPITP